MKSRINTETPIPCHSPYQNISDRQAIHETICNGDSNSFYKYYRASTQVTTMHSNHKQTELVKIRWDWLQLKQFLVLNISSSGIKMRSNYQFGPSLKDVRGLEVDIMSTWNWRSPKTPPHIGHSQLSVLIFPTIFSYCQRSTMVHVARDDKYISEVVCQMQ